MSDALQTLQTALTQLRAQTITAHDFSARARDQGALLEVLPPRFGEVLHPLLDRLESSALFTEESCSFSQRDLLDSIQMWLDKAEQRLTKN